MNLRYLATSREWFGGGADLTPSFPFAEDTAQFHQALKGACDAYRRDAYADFKAWCDRYFYLPHRREPRGVGGIFFDDLASADRPRGEPRGGGGIFFDALASADRAADFAFVRSVGEALLAAYPQIVARRKDLPFDDA